MAKSERTEKMVTVTVARGSIQKRHIRGEKATASDPVVLIGPGQQTEVPEREVEGLIARGTIVDPFAKPLSKDAADVDISGYFKSEDPNAPKITQGGPAAA